MQDPGGAFVVLLSVFVVILQDPGGRCCGKSLGPALTTKTCSSVFTIERSVLLLFSRNGSLGAEGAVAERHLHRLTLRKDSDDTDRFP